MKRLTVMGIVLTLGFGSAGAGGPVNPTVITGYDDGGIVLEDTFETIGTHNLGAGNWFVSAKLFVINTDASIPSVHFLVCKLGTATDLDKVRVGTAGTSWTHTPVWMSEVLRMPSGGGDASVQCKGDSVGDLTVYFVKFTAIKIGRTTSGRLGAQPTTAGRGSPRVLSVFKDRGTPFRENLKTVSKLDLPRGRWLIFARGTLTNNDAGHVAIVNCRLVGGDRKDLSVEQFVLTYTPRPIAHHLTTRFGRPGGAVQLRCVAELFDDEQVAKASRVELTAMRLGRLTEGTPTSTNSSGSGVPRVVSYHDGSRELLPGAEVYEEVASLPIPAGAWIIFARATIDQHGSPDVLKASCRLQAGGDFDDTTGTSGYFSWNVAHVFAGPGEATLSCAADSADDEMSTKFVRITAIKSDNLTNVGF